MSRRLFAVVGRRGDYPKLSSVAKYNYTTSVITRGVVAERARRKIVTSTANRRVSRDVCDVQRVYGIC